MSKQRDYRKEYDDFHAKPEQRKRRSQRNASRAVLKKKGVNVAGKDVDHINHNTADMSAKNLRAISVSKNRSDNGKAPKKKTKKKK